MTVDQGGGHGFVHLRVRSAYSLLEGAIKAEAIGKLALAAQMPAVALTDRTNLFGALEFSVATKDVGVQPIIGCALPLRDLGQRGAARWAKVPTVVLLAQNEAGYLNLSKLSSLAFVSSDAAEDPAISWATLVEHSEGLILLSGGPDGPVDGFFANGRDGEAHAVLDTMAEVFGNRFYIELQRHGLAAEASAEAGLVAYAYEHDIPLVATNDVYFGPADLYAAHEALLCIADGAFISQEDRRRVESCRNPCR